MKICYLADGNSVHTTRWLSYFADKGHDIHLITFERPSQPLKCKVYNLGKFSKLKFFLSVLKIRALLRKIKPDVIHAHYVTKYGACAALCGLPFIVSAWGGDISYVPEKSRILKLATEYVLKKATLVHTGDALGKNRLKELKCNKNKIFVQAWGTDINKFSPKAKTNLLRKELRLGNDFFVINVCNWTHKDYNQDVIIKAMPHVLKRIKNVRLFFVGKTDFELELKQLAEKIGVGENVVFLGKIPYADMPKYLSTADACIDAFFPSTNKAGSGLGVAILEAMACGAPQILAKRPEIDALGKQFGGLQFEPNNPKDLADKIVYILRTKNARKMGLISRQVALKIGNWNKNMADWEQIYKGFVKNKVMQK